MFRLAVYVFIIITTILTFAIWCINQALSAEIYNAPLKLPIIEIIDGDTIRTELTLPPPLNEIKIRILGIDTPEKPAKSYIDTGKLDRAKCDKEAQLALLAKKTVEDLLTKSIGYMIITDYKWDKYGGRIDAKVFFIHKQTNKHINVGEYLINNNLAVQYDGGTKEFNWCTEKLN